MNSTFSIKKFALSAHITFSVAWFGAIACFLVLAIAGLASNSSQTISSSYVAMELIGRYAIVPFCIAALITGLVQSYVTPWGLFRYYWVAVKLVLTIVSTVILFVHMKPISYVATVAKETTLSYFALRKLRIQLLADAGAAMLVLLIIITISVYKPWGKISSRENNHNSEHPLIKPVLKTRITRPWSFYILLTLIVLVILMFIVMHLKNGGLHRHVQF